MIYIFVSPGFLSSILSAVTNICSGEQDQDLCLLLYRTWRLVRDTHSTVMLYIFVSPGFLSSILSAVSNICSGEQDQDLCLLLFRTWRLVRDTHATVMLNYSTKHPYWSLSSQWIVSRSFDRATFRHPFADQRQVFRICVSVMALKQVTCTVIVVSCDAGSWTSIKTRSPDAPPSDNEKLQQTLTQQSPGEFDKRIVSVTYFT